MDDLSFRDSIESGVPEYGSLDSFQYKVELKNETWRNVKPLIDSKVKFALMSDHPIILQRNLFYTLRHLLIDLGFQNQTVSQKSLKNQAEIIGIDNIGQIKPEFISSMII